LAPFAGLEPATL